MKLYERLSALDRSFLDIEEHGSHMHVAATLLFDANPLKRPDGSLDIERIRAYVESRLHLVPRYRQRIATMPLDESPIWIDDTSFNLQYHVRHTQLPPPADERTLKRLVGRIISQELDRGKPLWELWVVEGVERDRFALIVKLHHCMVDGVAGVDVLGKLLRVEPSAAFDSGPRWYPRPEPERGQLLRDELFHRVSKPAAFLARLGFLGFQPVKSLDTALETARSMVEVLGSSLRPASLTPLNPSQIGPHRRFDWARIDLAAVREIKRRLGGTINDVVLTLVAGAIGRYLSAHHTLLPDLDFRALVPVSVRSAEERGEVGNRVATLIARLPIGVVDPVRRHQQVVETTRELKESGQARGGELLEELADEIALPLISQAVRLAGNFLAYNVVVTNVPGPPVRLYLLDAPLLEAFPVVPLFRNQALGFALFSYCECLYFGLNSDWDRLPDLHDVADMLALEFEELAKGASDREAAANPSANPSA